MASREKTLEEIDSFYPLTKHQIEQLDSYVSLLLKWNQKFNLIGKSTEADIWQRHILDSAQLMKYISGDNLVLTDFGSGAGLPAVVLAVMGGKDIFESVNLIESNSKKTTFLSEAARVIAIDINIINKRAEEIDFLKSDVITARAFADLDKIFSYILPFLKKDSLCLLLKGCKSKEEIAEAKKAWKFNFELFPSIIEEENSGFVVKIQELGKL